MTTSDEGSEADLSEEELAARRSNRRTLLVILTFIVALGLVPLAMALISKVS